jgi:hypothetical protein
MEYVLDGMCCFVRLLLPLEASPWLLDNGVMEDRRVEDGGVANDVGHGRYDIDGVPHDRGVHGDAQTPALKKRRARGLRDCCLIKNIIASSSALCCKV